MGKDNVLIRASDTHPNIIPHFFNFTFYLDTWSIYRVFVNDSESPALLVVKAPKHFNNYMSFTVDEAEVEIFNQAVEGEYVYYAFSSDSFTEGTHTMTVNGPGVEPWSFTFIRDGSGGITIPEE